MTIRLLDDVTIALKGIYATADVECLPRRLLDYQNTTMDWRKCDKARDAIVQLLIMSGAKLTGPPRNIFLTMFAPFLIDDVESGRRPRSGA